MTPCSFGGNNAGRQFAAEWIRTAFHDVATTDVAAGTGGLDGSIWFELDRAENGGSAFNSTFNFFANLYSIRAFGGGPAGHERRRCQRGLRWVAHAVPRGPHRRP